ncbi:hypothetical protein TCSYLVIO_008880 [Trypanosoma cruzi]|uniref:AB hydrolase-1 domain-containing protein n=2 Tax=Trypanosoma cruzi TaxID=5693 RepID=V5AZF4_TRYCR|nr:hypothetical protein TCSYLVIO_008880 [Trypanosoma cruzi]ESS66280.1 hypothetical protein TCDM_05180 [Trypanosoma cruzi Dm28c]PBJ71438.1 hypothetical protein BCY84_16779 [Trypanosoma cruzi cruzi]KAF8289953.1 putative Alpha/beta hydrolase family [Trypanosoma cruzi]PWU84376.1 hypothetical protein C4B63_232g4 [Trypanosoma cruzi]
MFLIFARASFWVLHVIVHVIYIDIPRLQRAFKLMTEEKRTAKVEERIDFLSAGTNTRYFFSFESFADFCYTSPPYNGHISTLLCAFRPPKPIKYTRQVVDSVDGNPICLDWFLAEEKNSPANGIMIIFPGLASWSQTNYVQHYVWHAHDRGFHCCVFNARGMGDTPLTRPRLMSASWTGDLRWVTRTELSRTALSLRFGATAQNVWGVGFSLGGVVLAKYLHEEGQNMTKEFPFDAALIINSPLDTLAVSANIMQPENALYQKNLFGGLIRYAIRHKDMLKQLPGVNDDGIRQDPLRFLKRLRTINEFDAHITAPHNGFSNPEEYYAAVNTLTSLRHCTIPTLCVIARDDPVTGEPPRKKMRELVTANSLVAFLELPYGGHLGYIGSPVEEWRGDPSFMELLTCNICQASQGRG